MSDVIEQKLDAWLAGGKHSTWHKRHPYDLDRFYAFVDAVLDANDTLYWPDEIDEMVLGRFFELNPLFPKDEEGFPKDELGELKRAMREYFNELHGIVAFLNWKRNGTCAPLGG